MQNDCLVAKERKKYFPQQPKLLIFKYMYTFFEQLILDSLRKFSASMTIEKPLFQVETLLAAPDVVLHPATNEVYKLTLQCVRDCVEG